MMNNRVLTAAIKVLSHIDSVHKKRDIVNNIIEQTKLTDRTFTIDLLEGMRAEDLLEEEIKGRSHFQKLTVRGLDVVLFLRGVKLFLKALPAYRTKARAKFRVPLDQWPGLNWTTLRTLGDESGSEYFMHSMENSVDFEYTASHWFLIAVYKKYIQLMAASNDRPITKAILDFVFTDGIASHLQFWKDELSRMNEQTGPGQIREFMLSRLLGRNDWYFLSFIHECKQWDLEALPGLEKSRHWIGNALASIYQPDDITIEDFEEDMESITKKVKSSGSKIPFKSRTS